VVAAAAAEESAAAAGEAVAMTADELPEPVPGDEGTRDDADRDTEAAEDAAAAAPAAAESVGEPVAEEGNGPGLMPGETAAASADPIDYSIAADGSLVVLGAETLGQLARWLGTDVAKLRRLNGLKPKAALVMGRRLKVEPGGVAPAEFERVRAEWHRAQQAVYFERVRIVGADRHRLRTGESLWSLMRQHGVPAWLLQQYNPDLDFGTLKVGMEINVPRIHVTAVGESG
jgi:membrane-bound lytic murein transglycosylase D